MDTIVDHSLVTELAGQTSGSVLSPRDAGYGAARGRLRPNYDRLVEIKRRYDPDNLFQLNDSIAP